MPIRYRLLILLLCLPLCACLNNLQLGPDLVETSDGFRQAMRWKDFPRASHYLDPGLRDDFLDIFREDPDLHIVDSRVLLIRPQTDRSAARVDYRIDYYRLPSTRVRQWHWQQHWELIPQPAPLPAIWMIRNLPPESP